MVAIVAGNSLGLTLTSLATVGQGGVEGSSAAGRNGERVYLNAATGNVVVQDGDERFAARGTDLTGIRTYNSQGRMVGGVADNWAVGAARQRLVPPGTWGAGTLVRVDHDGAEATYTWDGTQSITLYTYNTQGQLLTLRQPGATGAAGGVTSYAYDGLGREISRTDALGQLTLSTYDDANLRTTLKLANGLSTLSTYDKAGNLIVVANSSSTGSDLGATRYTYDADDRLIMTTDATGVRTFRLYDPQGRLVGEVDGDGTYKTTTYTASDGLVTELYRYDGQDRLTSIERDGMQIDRRLYDAASRVVKTGGADNLPVEFMKKLYGVDASGRPLPGNGSQRRLNAYNVKGQMVVQQVLRSDGTNDSRTTSDYDLAGNLKTTKVMDDAGGGTNTYTTTFAAFEGYKEAGVSGASTRLRPGTTTSSYDANGNLVSVTDPNKPENNRTFVNDVNGRVLAVQQGTHLLRELIVNGEVLGQYGQGIDKVNPRLANGNPVFNNNIADFQLGYQSITPSYPSASPGAYVVRSGDTLSSIAQSAYGDSRRWYQVAQANGMDSDSDLRVGQTLNLPNLVGGAHNGAGDFTPYDPSKVVGDTSPHLAAPKRSGSFLGQLLAAVAAIAVAYFTGIYLADMFCVNMGVLSATSATIGATAAAAGSIAGQAVGIAVGTQEQFSWKQVGLSAVSAGVTQGLGGVDFGLGKTGNAVARAAATNVATQGLGLVAGMQRGFNWRGVAASAVGAGVGQVVDSQMPNNFGGRLASGLTAGTAAAVMRGGRISVQQIAVDAFGAVIGERLAEGSGLTAPSSQLTADMDVATIAGLRAELGLPSIEQPEVWHLAADNGYTLGRGLEGAHVTEGPMSKDDLRRWEIQRMNESQLSGSERLKAHALGLYDAGVASVEGAAISLGLLGTRAERIAWAGSVAQSAAESLKRLYDSPRGTISGWWDGLTGNDPDAVRQATSEGAGVAIGVAGGYLAGRLAAVKMPLNAGVRTRIFNGLEVDASLPPPAAGWDYSPTLVQRASTENQAYSHWTGFQAEIALANEVAKREVVVKWGGALGTNGSDVISVQPATGAVTLWDSKYRSAAGAIQESPTFASVNRLSNAVNEAIETIQSSELPFATKIASIQDLQGGVFTTKTVGSGGVRNSVVIRYVNGKPR